MVTREEALPGRSAYSYSLARRHAVLGTDMLGPCSASEYPPVIDRDRNADLPSWPADAESIVLAGGCFWGVERILWQLPAVHVTACGYAGGWTSHPTYDEVCSAQTGHAEAVLVVYTHGTSTLRNLLEQFWQQHDPTTAMRQGNDIGTQYRSAVYWTTPEQEELVRQGARTYQSALSAAGRGQLTTELLPLREAGCGQFFYAEPDHQQYLATHPDGYCNHGFNGITCRIA
ncbi:peptide-methionine (S)-S-oxide reductase MsrA [Devriesea agamarum]|uniref:peptide-methionine (S)-S-oxide reductase MsrA n=1 Tax=Devriesea agamarum TaxID=472569 RepID=UPI001E480067|nr:peptide-methionine (S)-S-oxide reductase MsrA [Devriesea agamarum]